MKKTKNYLISSIFLFLLFFILIILLKTIDVQYTGLRDTQIGLATINLTLKDFIGVHMIYYTITDWLGVSGILIASIFAVLGLVQWIKRKHILKVDIELLFLGCLYLFIIANYIFFNVIVVNYRPIIIYNNPEPSFPSSHTFITITIMLTSIVLINKYFLSKKILNKLFKAIVIIISIITLIGRILSGVHWVTDILGGVLLSLAFTNLYIFFVNTFNEKFLR